MRGSPIRCRIYETTYVAIAKYGLHKHGNVSVSEAARPPSCHPAPTALGQWFPVRKAPGGVTQGFSSALCRPPTRAPLRPILPLPTTFEGVKIWHQWAGAHLKVCVFRSYCKPRRPQRSAPADFSHLLSPWARLCRPLRAWVIRQCVDSGTSVRPSSTPPALNAVHSLRARLKSFFFNKILGYLSQLLPVPLCFQ